MKYVWWILGILGGLVLLSLVKVIADTVYTNRRIRREGGMKVKYARLISFLLNNREEARVTEEAVTYLALYVRDKGGSFVFCLRHTFHTLFVRCDFASKQKGDGTLYWNFHEAMSQDEMIATIERNLSSLGR